MYNISRKNTLGIHLRRFKKEFPRKGDYDFFPVTWLYPTDFYDINEYQQNKINKANTPAANKKPIASGSFVSGLGANNNQSNKEPIVLFISKPEASSQGRGIFIFRKVDEMRQTLNRELQIQQKQYQEYIQAQQQFEIANYYSYTTQNASSFLINSSTNQQIQQNQQPCGGYQAAASQQGIQEKLASQLNYNIREPPQAIEKNNTYVVQKYIKNPALIDGHKFDFRIYVLVTSVVDPLTIFLYNDGLVRLASEKYNLSKNGVQDHYMHLTNYSLNKKNTKNFDGEKHKLRLSDCLAQGISSVHPEKGTFRKSSKELWVEIEDIVIKTVITIQPQLQHYYRSCQPREPDLCYELLGFDIMLDRKLKPWLLEVNHLPSFNHDTSVDCQVKTDLIRDMFTILKLSIENRKSVHRDLRQEQKVAMQTGGCFKRLTVKEHIERVRFDATCVAKLDPKNGFKLIFPRIGSSSTDDDTKYDRFLRKAHEIWQVTTGTVRASALQQNSSSGPSKKKKRLKKKISANTNQPNSNQNNLEEGTPTVVEYQQENDDDDNCNQPGQTPRGVNSVIEIMDNAMASPYPLNNGEERNIQSNDTQNQPAQPNQQQTTSATTATKPSKLAIARQVTERLYPQKQKNANPPQPQTASNLDVRHSFPNKQQSKQPNTAEQSVAKSSANLRCDNNNNNSGTAKQQCMNINALDQLALETSHILDENFINNSQFAGGGSGFSSNLFMLASPSNNIYANMEMNDVDQLIKQLTSNYHTGQRGLQTQLRFKEYCRGLFDDNPQVTGSLHNYYRTSSLGYQHNLSHYDGASQQCPPPIIITSTSGMNQETGSGSIKNNRSTALLAAYGGGGGSSGQQEVHGTEGKTSARASHQQSSNNIPISTPQTNQQKQANSNEFSWSSKSGQAFVQKLKNTVQQSSAQKPNNQASPTHASLGMLNGTVNANSLLKQHQLLQQQSNRQQNLPNCSKGGVNSSLCDRSGLAPLDEQSALLQQRKALLFQANQYFPHGIPDNLLGPLNNAALTSSSFKASIFKNDFINTTIQTTSTAVNDSKLIPTSSYIPPSLLQNYSIANNSNNQRIIFRCDSINGGGHHLHPNAPVVDIVPINMSAGILDFKSQQAKGGGGHPNLHSTDPMSMLNVGYKRHNRRLQSSNNNGNTNGGRPSNGKNSALQPLNNNNGESSQKQGGVDNSWQEQLSFMKVTNVPSTLQNNEIDFYEANKQPRNSTNLTLANNNHLYMSNNLTNFVGSRKDSKYSHHSHSSNPHRTANIIALNEGNMSATAAQSSAINMSNNREFLLNNIQGANNSKHATKQDRSHAQNTTNLMKAILGGQIIIEGLGEPISQASEARKAFEQSHQSTTGKKILLIENIGSAATNHQTSSNLDKLKEYEKLLLIKAQKDKEQSNNQNQQSPLTNLSTANKASSHLFHQKKNSSSHSHSRLNS